MLSGVYESKVVCTRLSLLDDSGNCYNYHNAVVFIKLVSLVILLFCVLIQIYSMVSFQSVWKIVVQCTDSQRTN